MFVSLSLTGRSIGIVLAIPYGALADHIGRKPVLLLGMLGCILSEVWIRLVCKFAR